MITKAEWLEKNNFNEDGFTFVYAGSDSFARKEELKEAGFTFNSSLLWHRAEPMEGCIAISAQEVLEFSNDIPWYMETAYATVQAKIQEIYPIPDSEWMFEEKERVYDVPVKLTAIIPFVGKYGFNQVVRFLAGDNELIWFTTTNIPFEVNDKLLLTGTCKKRDIYKGRKITIMTRCKLKMAE